jgi:hypothetical protein
MDPIAVINWLNTQEWLKLAIFEYETRGKAGLDALAAEKYNRHKKRGADELAKAFLMVKNRETALNDAISVWVRRNHAIPKELARLNHLIHSTDPVDTPEEHHERIQLRILYNRARAFSREVA